MKFQHLPIGARFEFEGKHYTKTTPLVGIEEGGGQRMIPRYAVLRGLGDGMVVTPDITESQLDVDGVLAAFAEFELVASRLLHEATGAEGEQLATLTAAGRIFRNKINHK